MATKLKFVKGHCGWDVVTLLPAGQITQEEELAASLQILDQPIQGGLEVGWLQATGQANEIELRMVNSTTRTWIPMCGGMTQVIGHALIHSFLRDVFNIDAGKTIVDVVLLTPSGRIPLRIEHADGKTITVTTMDEYVASLKQTGFEALTLRGVPLLRVGKYAAIDMRDLEARHPELDFTRRDPGSHLDVVNELLRSFRDRMGTIGVNGMLYDDRPEGPGQYRVFPRFYSDDLAAASLPWEFQCGTGGIVVAAALAHGQRLPFKIEGDIVLEWGSFRTTRDPYGIRTSTLSLALNDAVLERASFSHSKVELIAEGELTLPDY